MLDAEYSESGLEGHFSDTPFQPYEITPSGASMERLLRLPKSETAPARAPSGPSRTREPSREEKPKAPDQDDKAKAKEGEAKPADEQKTEKDKKSPGFLRRRPLLSMALVSLAALAVAAGYVWWENAEHFESTDDAFIASRQIAIAPQVTGYITSVPVTDNQHLAAGDVIAKLDDRNYQAALDQANAQVASAKASIANVEAQTDVQDAQIEAGKAQVDQAQATAAFAKQQASRYGQLAKTGAGSVENAQQYTSQLGQQDAAVKTAQANELVAERQLEALKAQMQSAEANLSVANAQREQALLNLSYTTVNATEPGRVVNLTAEPGEFAQPGTNLTMFVPDETWIVANYKETQLDQMRPGQPVTFTIDAYPERELTGRVASVQPGSGTAFSLLPAQNATGNYVKVVQRVPVKIVLDNPPPDVALGPGMSITPTVRTDPRPTIWEKLTAASEPYQRRLEGYWSRL
jgi:membrane fusion protein (multidrug efflux system)